MSSFVSASFSSVIKSEKLTICTTDKVHVLIYLACLNVEGETAELGKAAVATKLPAMNQLNAINGSWNILHWINGPNMY